jgi:hypothetical protein
MASEMDPLDLLGHEPDPRLLGEDLGKLPASVAPPPAPLPESAARRQVVRAGATMTGVTLIGGLALSLLGLVRLLTDGGILSLVVLVLGIVLVSTHWGWVHVAELTGNRIEGHRHASLADRQAAWLREIEPYPHWEVSTSAGDDGSITILTVCHRPIATGEQTFSFVSEEVAREVHSADEPAAAVTERAELLRRQAAIDTQQARERYEVARDAYEHALIARDDEQQRVAALRAASEALSERINTNLRDPPLVE